MDQSSGDWRLWSVSLELLWPLCWVGCLRTRAGSQAASPSPTSLPCCTSRRGCVLLVVPVGFPVPPSPLCPWRPEPLQGCDGHGPRCCLSLEPLSSSPGGQGAPGWASCVTQHMSPALCYLWWCIYFHATLRSSPPVLVPLCLQVCSLYVEKKYL